MGGVQGVQGEESGARIQESGGFGSWKGRFAAGLARGAFLTSHGLRSVSDN